MDMFAGLVGSAHGSLSMVASLTACSESGRFGDPADRSASSALIESPPGSSLSRRGKMGRHRCSVLLFFTFFLLLMESASCGTSWSSSFDRVRIRGDAIRAAIAVAILFFFSFFLFFFKFFSFFTQGVRIMPD
jgi:hypothetical protein